MDEFLQKRPELVRLILQQDCLAGNGICTRCQSTQGLWRCLECLGRQALCRDCLRESHKVHPFHRIQFWTGTHYRADWLRNIGVAINLGHAGDCCPSRSSTADQASYEPPPAKIRALKDHIDPYESPSKTIDTPADAKLMTVIHTNGIHTIWIRQCQCHEGQVVEHLLQQALFPATFKSPKTVFTFGLLDDFRKANVECQTTAYGYFHKLRRMNSEFFPTSCPVGTNYHPASISHSAKDRYREFNRLAQQWMNIKDWKWAGIPYDYGDKAFPADAGVLAHFCVSCPQPGINLPTNWKDDPDQLAYTRIFVSDGNFSAIHQKNERALPETALTNGDLFLVGETRYASHLKVALEIKGVGSIFTSDQLLLADFMIQKSTCHQHHAVNDRFVKYKGLDITGVAATACGRHGAFCPGGVVNLQRGEAYVSIHLLYL